MQIAKLKAFECNHSFANVGWGTWSSSSRIGAMYLETLSNHTPEEHTLESLGSVTKRGQSVSCELVLLFV
jgi:hypothetical protein